MEKLRQNKHFVTIVCLILGGVLLCSAAVANIGNAGGYNAYKRGLIGLLSISDYSGDGYLDLELDGQQVFRMNYQEAYNSKAKPGEAISYSRMYGSSDFFNDIALESENWRLVNEADHITGAPYTVYERQTAELPGLPEQWKLSRSYDPGVIFHLLGEDLDLSDSYTAKLFRVCELALDMVVGDLKNNFIYMGRQDGLRNFRVSLSGDQLPEIVQAVISLIFDSENVDHFFSTSQVIRATDFDWDKFYGYDEGKDWSEERHQEYQDAVAHAYDIIREHDDQGCVVVYQDLSVQWFPSAGDYYITLENTALPTLIKDGELGILLCLLKGEPTIQSATCDLSIDDAGRLMANTLSGTADFRLIDGSSHSVTLTIHGSFSSREEGAVIPLPQIPDSARVEDYSIQCLENDYEFTVRENGVTTTYHQQITPTAEAFAEGCADLLEFVALNEFEQIDRVSAELSGGGMTLYLAEQFEGQDGSESADYRFACFSEDGEGLYVYREEFQDVCETLFSTGYCIREYADWLGVTCNALQDELLEDYRQICGRDYEGELSVQQSEGSPEMLLSEYFRSRSLFDQLCEAAECCGVPIEWVEEDELTDGDWLECSSLKFSDNDYLRIVYVSSDQIPKAAAAIHSGDHIEDYAAKVGLTRDCAASLIDYCIESVVGSGVQVSSQSGGLDIVGGTDWSSGIFVVEPTAVPLSPEENG